LLAVAGRFRHLLAKLHSFTRAVAQPSLASSSVLPNRLDLGNLKETRRSNTNSRRRRASAVFRTDWRPRGASRRSGWARPRSRIRRFLPACRSPWVKPPVKAAARKAAPLSWGLDATRSLARSLLRFSPFPHVIVSVVGKPDHAHRPGVVTPNS
jgi:hypothetical protein